MPLSALESCELERGGAAAGPLAAALRPVSLSRGPGHSRGSSNTIIFAECVNSPSLLKVSFDLCFLFLVLSPGFSPYGQPPAPSMRPKRRSRGSASHVPKACPVGPPSQSRDVFSSLLCSQCLWFFPATGTPFKSPFLPPLSSKLSYAVLSLPGIRQKEKCKTDKINMNFADEVLGREEYGKHL